MSVQMNRLIRGIETLPHVFDFDRGGLADDMMSITAEAILEAMEQETPPTGGGWDELSEAYAAWKSRAYPGQPMAVLEGHMRTLEQLIGLPRVTAREVIQTYGVDELARLLAEWFQEGNEKQNRPPRPFYLFGDIARDRLKDLFDRHFADAMP